MLINFAHNSWWSVLKKIEKNKSNYQVKESIVLKELGLFMDSFMSGKLEKNLFFF